MTNNMTLEISTQTKKPSDLVSMVKRMQLQVSRVNRNINWDTLPNNRSKKKSNGRDFILFLFKTKDTMNPFQWAKYIINNKEMYVSLDGNNRTNQIYFFNENPLRYFPEKLQDLPIIDISLLAVRDEDLKSTEKFNNKFKNIIGKVPYKLLSSPGTKYSIRDWFVDEYIKTLNNKK